MNTIAFDIGASFGTPYTSLGDISRLASSLTQNLLMLAGVVLIFSIVYSGISMLSSSGDPQGFAKAKTMLTSSVIGFIMVVAAFFITWIVETMFGIDILS